MSQFVYGVYHGEFIEMLFTHFDKDFFSAQRTANATEPDSIA